MDFRIAKSKARQLRRADENVAGVAFYVAEM
jgi:hypothetical protein